MTIVSRRKLIEAAQALAKTNSPTLEHYENMLFAVAKVYSDDVGRECDCVIREKKTAIREVK